MRSVYDDRIGRSIPGYEVLHRLAGTLLAAEVPETASLLIAGAGTGKEMIEWGALHSAWTFTAVDPSQAMLAVAKEKPEQNSMLARTTFQVGTVDQLSEDLTFDAGTLLLVLHFLPEDDQKRDLLAAVAQRLKAGAPLLLATLFGDPQSTRYKKAMNWAKAWALSQGLDPAQAEEYFNPARADLYVIPEERLKVLLREAGYIDVQRFYQAAAIGAWIARLPR